MRIVKIALIAVAAIVVLVLAIAAFVNKDYRVVREIVIRQPRQQVFDYIRYLKNQDHYSKWATLDPKVKNVFTGVDGTVGAVNSWESENKQVGKGEQEIVAIRDGERIDWEIRFKEPFEAVGTAFMETHSMPDSQTHVVWAFEGRMKYPTNIMMLFMDMDKELGGDLDFGLQKLKTLLESQPTVTPTAAPASDEPQQ